MRSAAIGIGTIWVIFYTFVCMSALITDSIMYQEASIACNEAIYETELMLTEEENSINSNQDMIEVFSNMVRPLLGHHEKYSIEIYGVDYREGLLSVAISYDCDSEIMRELGQSRHRSVRRTMIIDKAS